MKRFLVFGYDQYYPSGGWNDYLGCFDTLDGAKELIAAKGTARDYYDVIDTNIVNDSAGFSVRGLVYDEHR